MDVHDFLVGCIVYLAAAVIAVPLFKRLGLGAVLGYLAAGIAIGPACFGLVEDVQAMLHFAEFGVVLLLFVIGLELQPSRLRVFRTQILRSGSLQMVLTALLLFIALRWLVGLSNVASLVLAFALALSSTAFALQTLAEKKQLTTGYGREAFAILLFQDLAVIPALAILPVLGGAGDGGWIHGLLQTMQAAAVIVGFVVAGHYLLSPLLGMVARADNREVFTAASLLLVFGASVLLESIGLSMALGAFLAGVLVADSEYRHALEADIEPFKGLLLGLFFIAVGMSVNIALIFQRPGLILLLAIGLLVLKAAVLFLVGQVARLRDDSPARLALIMPQGGEFAFVILTVAVASGLLDEPTSDLVIVVVTTSMVLSPLIYSAYEKLSRRGRTLPPPDTIEPENNHVIIAGFGRFGQIVARVLAMEQIPFTALERSPEQVDFVRRFGNTIYYGDASRLDLLEAANAQQARALILAIDDAEDSVHAASIIRAHFPDLPILARARNRQHAYRLLDLGITSVLRETLDSSLHMSQDLLRLLGYDAPAAEQAVKRFGDHDAALLLRQHAIHNDEQALVQSAVESREELRRLFSADHEGDDKKKAVQSAARDINNEQT